MSTPVASGVSRSEGVHYMEESSFEMDSRQVRTLAHGYPSRHKEVPQAHPDADFTYLRKPAGAEFREHCWDECGH